ncbi:MAG: trimeric intracellular cation channel family protein [Candidatus Delongbacteria bacterium]|nr:trimeric intracellular cation channel family protein [Candidatus Delongbacteria bacterium]MDD4205034.1 trimeric intracellular cation channel family protein [Candidatus Delongbacteria bacterium]
MSSIYIFYLGVIGTFAFAISGAMTAMRKRFDPFGVIIIGFVTAVGGGTVRDILIKDAEVFWLTEPAYVYSIVAGSIFAMTFSRKMQSFTKSLLLFDTIGLGLYTIVGLEIGLHNGLSFMICVILGTITGSFGGIIRDILVNEIPVIFHKEIYATVSILGGLFYFLLKTLEVPDPMLQIIPVIFIIICRLLVIKFKISYPQLYRNS